MKAITLVAIAQSVAMDLQVIGVNLEDASPDAFKIRWIADVSAEYGGQRHVVKGHGESAEGAQMRALALAVKAALPKPVLTELLALENEDTA